MIRIVEMVEGVDPVVVKRVGLWGFIIGKARFGLPLVIGIRTKQPISLQSKRRISIG